MPAGFSPLPAGPASYVRSLLVPGVTRPCRCRSSLGDLAKAGLPEDGVTLTNPLHAEESVLRTSLLPGQLKAIAYNQSHRNPDVRFFEIDHVFLPSPEGELLPDEREFLAVAIAGEELLRPSPCSMRSTGRWPCRIFN